MTRLNSFERRLSGPGRLVLLLIWALILTANWTSDSEAAPPLSVEEDATKPAGEPTTRDGDIYVHRIWSETKHITKGSRTKKKKLLCVSVANRGPHRSPRYKVRAFLSQQNAMQPPTATGVLDSTWQQSLRKGQARKHCWTVSSSYSGPHVARSLLDLRDYYGIREPNKGHPGDGRHRDVRYHSAGV